MWKIIPKLLLNSQHEWNPFLSPIIRSAVKVYITNCTAVYAFYFIVYLISGINWALNNINRHPIISEILMADWISQIGIQQEEKSDWLMYYLCWSMVIVVYLGSTCSTCDAQSESFLEEIQLLIDNTLAIVWKLMLLLFYLLLILASADQ